MKKQSLLFLASQERAGSPFLWAAALRLRQQNLRRANGGVGPICDSVVEWTPRRGGPSTQN